ncbi:RDD family protein [Staphylospora marina]|uniref:RDD family protein n=1 Tax=Staphylospora marina TaxID=2490858 RepID=UPI000F5BE5EC|nr:RDD family protein [Staphylospora marina]
MKNITEIHTPENVRIPVETAGLFTRGMAKLIDLLIVAGAFIPLGMLMIGMSMFSEFMALTYVVASAFPLAYFVVTETWMRGQTLGKKLLGIRVVSDHGGHPGLAAVILRNLMLLADLLPFGFLFGMASIFLSRREKRLGDLAAGTLVVMELREKEELELFHTDPWLTPREEVILKQIPVLSGHRFSVLQSFLIRRKELKPDAREKLVQSMLEAWWPEIETKPGYEEAFLEKAYLYLRQNAYPSDLPRIIRIPTDPVRHQARSA